MRLLIITILLVLNASTIAQSHNSLSLTLNVFGNMDNFQDIKTEMDVEDFYYNGGTELNLSYSFFNNFSIGVYGQYNVIGNYSKYSDTISSAIVGWISENVVYSQEHLFLSEMKQFGLVLGYKFKPKSRIIPFGNLKIGYLNFSPYSYAYNSSDTRHTSWVLNYPSMDEFDYDQDKKQALKQFFPQQKFINLGTEIGIEIIMSNTLNFIFSARFDNLNKKVNYDVIEAVNFEKDKILGLKYSSAPLNNIFFNMGVRFNLLNSKK
jgi:hypothetical protein